MADDIDDLLNEVESKFCASGKKTSSEKVRNSVDGGKEEKTGTSKHSHGNKKSSDADLNAMIDDIFDDSVPLDPSPSDKKQSRKSSLNTTSSVSATKSSGAAKCFPIFLGGMKYPKGLCTAVNQRVCDSLRCTDCDFKVEIFDDRSWHPKTDYLFLRNNMPDFEKLKSNLLHRKGWRAYGCQCKSKSVDDMTNIQETNMKWVCGKH